MQILKTNKCIWEIPDDQYKKNLIGLWVPELKHAKPYLSNEVLTEADDLFYILEQLTPDTTKHHRTSPVILPGTYCYESPTDNSRHSFQFLLLPYKQDHTTLNGDLLTQQLRMLTRFAGKTQQTIYLPPLLDYSTIARFPTRDYLKRYLGMLEQTFHNFKAPNLYLVEKN